ncbi:MAG: hypothetical protein JXR22_08455 [Prolixibacteraceae bacterium]|nr:hypothetical protein [Prolixibacteraceae bacterium]
MKRVLPIVLLMFFIVSCELLPENLRPDSWLPDLGEEKVLTAEEAKVEIRSANQDLTVRRENMLQTKGFSSLMYFSELMESEDAYAMKSADFRATWYQKSLSYSNVFNYFRGKNSLKSAKVVEEEGMYGYFVYNFSTGTFDMVSESNNTLEFIYPADDAAKYSQQNNAQMTITDLEFVEVISYEDVYDYNTGTYVQEETTEQMPVNADVVLKIDNALELTANYQASYSNEGMPLSMDCSMESSGNKMKVEQREKALAYTAKISMVQDGETLIDANLDVTYNADKSAVKTYKGYSIMTPLKFEGTVNAEAIEKYTDEYEEAGTEPDLDYLNSQIDVEVFQYEDKAKIGHLAYYMYYDPEYDESVPALAIVYEDGTYEWLEEVMTVAEM